MIHRASHILASTRKRRSRCNILVLPPAFILVLAVPALGQLTQQNFQLEAGWNSIFLEVNAAPASADELFGSLPIESVWMRAPEPIEGEGFLCQGPDDPNCREIEDTLWRAWYRPGPGAEAMTTLRVIRGGNSYLINASAPTLLTIVGVPAGFSPRYRPGFNLRGFHVVDDPAQTPTLANYLAPKQSSLTPNVHILQADGTLTAVSTASRILPGRAYWVPATAEFTYDGPIRIGGDGGGGVVFGTRLDSLGLTLFNEASATRNVTVTYLSSLASPIPDQPTYAGDVPVLWLRISSGTAGIDELFQWVELGTNTVSIPARASDVLNARQMTLGVERRGLAAAFLDANMQGSQYQGLLEIKDGAGFRRVIGVSAEVTGVLSSAVAGTSTDRPGLYIGTVRVNRVGWVTAGARVWTNTDADNPEFADLTRCFGGDNDGAECLPGRKLCAGNPTVEQQRQVCEEDTECPSGTVCAPDCPGTQPGGEPAVCSGFCIGGIHDGGSCTNSNQCETAVPEDSGACSADMLTEPLRPTDDEFVFPVLIHLSDTGEYKLLTEVTMRVTADGQRLLQTPDCPSEQCDQYEGAWIVNGQSFSRRVSTAAFAFEDDLTMVSAGGFAGTLRGTIVIDPNHPLNPFRHKFHPDHDCLDEEGTPLGPGAVESECFRVTRFIEFVFDPDPPDGSAILNWGDSIVGGTYKETLAGLHREPLRVEGDFELSRVSSIEKLNTPVDSGVLP